ncbi:MAG: hypothetical protein U0527_05945 [Candidatus Eisenbacteria bacterium]
MLTARLRADGWKPVLSDSSGFDFYPVATEVRVEGQVGLRDNEHGYLFGADYTPVAISSDGHALNEVVFVGYGLSAPERGYDDYAGQEVKGKIVVAFLHGAPGGSSGRGLLGGGAEPYGSLYRKAETALLHGAAALIVTPPPSAPSTSDRGWRLSSELAARDAGIPALVDPRRAFAARRSRPRRGAEVDRCAARAPLPARAGAPRRGADPASAKRRGGAEQPADASGRPALGSCGARRHERRPPPDRLDQRGRGWPGRRASRASSRRQRRCRRGGHAAADRGGHADGAALAHRLPRLVSGHELGGAGARSIAGKLHDIATVLFVHAMGHGGATRVECADESLLAAIAEANASLPTPIKLEPTTTLSSWDELIPFRARSAETIALVGPGAATDGTASDLPKMIDADALVARARLAFAAAQALARR